MQSFKSPSLGRVGRLTAPPGGPGRERLGLWELEDPREFLAVRGEGGAGLSVRIGHGSMKGHGIWEKGRPAAVGRGRRQGRYFRPNFSHRGARQRWSESRSVTGWGRGNGRGPGLAESPGAPSWGPAPPAPPTRAPWPLRWALLSTRPSVPRPLGVPSDVHRPVQTRPPFPPKRLLLSLPALPTCHHHPSPGRAGPGSSLHTSRSCIQPPSPSAWPPPAGQAPPHWAPGFHTVHCEQGQLLNNLSMSSPPDNPQAASHGLRTKSISCPSHKTPSPALTSPIPQPEAPSMLDTSGGSPTRHPLPLHPANGCSSFRSTLRGPAGSRHRLCPQHSSPRDFTGPT